ncbi:VP [Bat associated nodavirus]|nr:VP [Bat associated nodavirus]
MPEMTHRLSVADRTFLENFLDPCDERVGPSTLSKIPDGAIQNSGINGFREQFNVEVPFSLPAGSEIVSGGPVWTLLVLRLPTIKVALYLIAYQGRSDLSVNDQNLIVDYYNTGDTPTFPEWGQVNTTIRMTQVEFTLLRAFPNLRALMLQARITKTGITTYHNAPDLFNQGMIICGQWNLDQAAKAGASTLGMVGSPVLYSNEITFTTVNSVNVPDLFRASLPEGRTVTFPLVRNDTDTSWSGTSEPLSAVELGFTGSVFIESNGTSLTLTVVDDLIITMTGSRGAGPGGNFTVIYAAVGPGGERRTTQRLTNFATEALTALRFNSRWTVTGETVLTTGVDVILPPLDQQSIIQSSPKSVTMPSKQFNGAYSVGRVWEPVLNMQEIDNQGVIRWRRRGAAALGDPLRASGFGDVLDLNFGTIVQVHAGLAYAASITIKIVMDLEFVAGENSPWQAQMMPNHNVDTEVIAMARAISMEQPFAFPQTYNSLGKLFDMLSGVLEKIPVIGNAVPVIKQLAKTFFGDKEENPQCTNVPSQPGGDLAQVVVQLLRKLGLE